MSDSDLEKYVNSTLEYTIRQDIRLGNIDVHSSAEDYISNNGW